MNATKVNPLNKQGVVTVYVAPRWTFDRLYAVFILLVAMAHKRGLGLDLETIKGLVRFERVRYDRMQEDRIEAAEANGDVVVGLGSRYYAACNKQSDSQIMAERLGITPSDDLSSLWDLIHMVNADNASGVLKKFKNSPSLVYLIREIQKRQYTWTRKQVFEEAITILFAWWQSGEEKRDPNDLPEESKLQRVLNRATGGKKGSYGDFSIRHYIDLMYMAGWEIEQIQAHAAFWMDANDLTRKTRGALGEVYAEAAKSGNVRSDGRIVAIRTDNEDLGDYLVKEGRHDIVLVSRESADEAESNGRFRNAVILTREGFDLDPLAEYLFEHEGDALEGGKWRYDKRTAGSGMLLNGSGMRPMPPTSLSTDDLIEAIKKYVTPVTK